MRSEWMNTKEAAEYLGRSVRFVLDRAPRGAIPSRLPAGCRDRLYLAAELDAWIEGCELENVRTANGGHICRPVSATKAAA